MVILCNALIHSLQSSEHIHSQTLPPVTSLWLFMPPTLLSQLPLVLAYYGSDSSCLSITGPSEHILNILLAIRSSHFILLLRHLLWMSNFMFPHHCQSTKIHFHVMIFLSGKCVLSFFIWESPNN